MRVASLSALVAGFLLIAAGPASAATITVPTTADTSGSQCTLRDAIHAANFDSPEGACSTGSGPDVISITAVGTITLGSALPQIDSGLTVTVRATRPWSQSRPMARASASSTSTPRRT